MSTEKSQKIPFFYSCESCDYNTSSKKDYSKHCLTRKHQKMTFVNKTSTICQQKNPFFCVCGKKYKERTGLWKHNQNCDFKNCDDAKNPKKKSPDLNNSDPTTILSILHQNTEFKELLLEQHKIILEMSKNAQSTTINSNNINSNNKTFNLQLFLNETCKEAMNIMDFVESLKLKLSDLENVGKVGFVNGISTIIVKNLKAIDIDKRPVHCSDSKREVIYVKDENKWEKETETKHRLKNAIKQIAHKNCKLINEWKDKNPDCILSCSKKSDQYNHIVLESMGGVDDTDVNANKIIKNVVKEVTIDKQIV